MRELNKNRDRAIVIGAGFGGLAAAAALAPRYSRVDIFEKDDITDSVSVRAGVNQGAHVHTLLRGGQNCLEALIPGLEQAFKDAGAVEIDVGDQFRFFDFGSWRTQRRIGITMLLMSRPAYEKSLREKVLEFGNLTLHDGQKVEKLLFEGDRVAGITLGSGDGKTEERADLTVDARGRGGRLPAELHDHGFGETPETVIGIKMSYVSGIFDPPPQHRGDPCAILVRPEPPDCRYGLVCPIENGRWVISLGGRSNTTPPMDIDGFFDYAEALCAPEFYQHIKGAALVGDLHRYRKPTANWRRYDQLERMPKDFVPLGDTITSFNPTFGQGMTVAARHANSLAAALDAQSTDNPAFMQAYLPPAMQASGEAWAIAGNADMAYPEVEGERPAGFEQILAFSRGLKLLANDDVEIQRLGMEVAHMMRSPRDLRTEDIAGRVMKKLFEMQT